MWDEYDEEEIQKIVRKTISNPKLANLTKLHYRLKEHHLLEFFLSFFFSLKKSKIPLEISYFLLHKNPYGSVHEIFG